MREAEEEKKEASESEEDFEVSKEDDEFEIIDQVASDGNAAAPLLSKKEFEIHEQTKTPRNTTNRTQIQRGKTLA